LVKLAIGLEVCPEHEYLWDRRSNLSGANFTIAVTPQSTLSKTKEVQARAVLHKQFRLFDQNPV